MKIPVDRSDFMKLFIGVTGRACTGNSFAIRVMKVEFDFIFGPLLAVDFDMRVDKVIQRFSFAGWDELDVSAG